MDRIATPTLRPAPLTAALLLCVSMTLEGCTDPPTGCPVDTGDLNSDGRVDDLDCAELSAGAAVRSICQGDPRMWRTNDHCATVTRSTIEAGQPDDVRTLRAQEGFAATIRGRVTIAVPPRQDQSPDAWRSTSSSGEISGEMSITESTPLSLVANGRVWFDRNDDLEIQSSEVLLLSALGFTGEALASISSTGHAVVAGNRLGFVDRWIDESGDLQVTADEIDSFPGGGRPPVGLDGEGVTYYDAQLDALAYADGSGFTRERIEVSPDCGRLASPEGEFRTCLAPRIAPRLVIGSQFIGPGPLYTTRHLMPSPNVWISGPLKQTPPGGFNEQPRFAAVHYNDKFGLNTWIDENLDFVIQDQEIATVAASETGDLAADIEFLSGAVEYVPSEAARTGQIVALIPRRQGNTIETIGLIRRPAVAYLGEDCDAATLCAGTMACADVGGRTACTSATP